MMRLRSSFVVVPLVAVLVACGDPDPGVRSTSDEATPTADTRAQPSEPTEPAPAPNGDDAPDVPLARCSDVARITTDVLSDTTAGNIDPAFHGVLLTYAADHVDTFGGLWVDREAFGTVVLAFTDDPAAHRAALAARRPSPDDVRAVEPPPEITDDRPIGEWGVAFDVVQVEHTDADLVAAIGPVTEAARSVAGPPVSGGLDVLRNRVGIDISTPVTRGDLVAIADAIADLGGIGPGMVCWSGQFLDEAPDPVEPGTPLGAIRLPDADGTFPADTPVSCGSLQFEVGDLENPTPADDVEPGLRSVLDGWLANSEGQYWPQDGWVLLTADDARASFLHLSDDGVSTVDAEKGANGWIWAGASGTDSCDVRLMLPPGVGEVDWVLDPDAPRPDASATEIRVLATERGCASGQAMGERLMGPEVAEADDVVLIAFGVIPQPGDQACPGNPSTPVVVELDAPLGDREIRDAMVIGPIASLLGN